MGCASSKQSNKRCRNCQAPYSPMPRSYSMHVIHPHQQKGDNYHLVALTSTTLGSLHLGDPPTSIISGAGDGLHWKESKGKKEFSMGLIEAKTWSRMIEEKIPKMANPRTPNVTPPGEPETINTWELMEGLEEDSSPCRFPNHHFRSFSFDVTSDANCLATVDSPQMSFTHVNRTFSPKVSHIKPKPIWAQLAEEEEAQEEVLEDEEEKEEEEDDDDDDDDDEPNKAKCGEYFDPNIISMFRKSMQELSPTHPFHLKPIQEAVGVQKGGKANDKVKDKVVVYFTSLRGVRKTYEDSCHVRVILKGLGVRIDERDVSMHSGFKEELRHLLGVVGGFSLPRVFIGKNYIGGAEEIRQMHEEGRLEKAVEGCEMADDGGGEGGGGVGGICEACGDVRFVPCETCSGSCKIYYEEEEEEDDDGDGEVEEEGNEGGEYGFRRCPDCNENGLIRCPICCSH